MENKTAMRKQRGKDVIEVDNDEILFIIEHKTKSFGSLIVEYLENKGITTDRITVHNEITKIKKSYNRPIIEAARFLLKSIKGVEYNK